MPLVRSIDILPDGIRIVTTARGTFIVSSNLMPSATRAAGATACETWVNNWLVTNLPAGMFAAVHITQVSPLVCNAIVSNEPVSGQWWP